MMPGLYETLLTVRGRAVLLTEHLSRLESSAKALALPLPAREEIDRAVSEAVADVTHLEEAMLRITLTVEQDPALSAVAAPLPDRVLRRRRLGRVIVLDPSWSRNLAMHKTWPNSDSEAALQLAQGEGADEALFVSDNGEILEGTSTNVFAVEGHTIRTPALMDAILPGTMRNWILKNATRAGLAVEEGPITRGELAAGGFLSSSLTLLAVIRDLNGSVVPSCENALTALYQLMRTELQIRSAGS